MAYGNYYQLVVEHRGLNKHRVIRGSDRRIVESKAFAQRAAWEEQYLKKLLAEERRAERDARQIALEEGLSEAEERTSEARAEIDELRRILADTLSVDDRINWEQLKDTAPFPKPQPEPKPYLPLPEEPRPDDPRYLPQLNFFDRMVQKAAGKKRAEAAELFAREYAMWQTRVTSANETNQQIYAENVAAFEQWQREAAACEEEQREANATVDEQRRKYQALEADAIVEYCDLVLSQSRYPSLFPREFELGYDPRSKTLVVDYTLPAPDALPRLQEVKFVRSRNQFTETLLTRKAFDELYEDVLCQVCLRTIHELLEADVVRAIETVVFNGHVCAVDPGTGNMETHCVMTMRTPREEFLDLNLRKIQPRRCFDSLGGKAGGKLTDLRPVKPLADIDRDQARFADAEDLNGPAASDEWRAFVSTIDEGEDARSVSVAELAKLIGMEASQKLSAAQSRQLAAAVAARGLAIEPDANLGSAPYRAGDEVAIFKPAGTWVGGSYVGAAALLHLTVSIAAADGEITPEELDASRSFIERDLSLSAEEHQRLVILERLLCRNPEMASRSMSRLSKRLSPEKRALVGEVLALVAVASGKITSREWKALDKAFKVLALPLDALDEIFRRCGIEFEEVIVEEAAPPAPGEPIPDAPMEESARPLATFSLDQERIAQISQETREVIGILAAVMADEVAPSPSAEPIPVPSSRLASPDWLKSLDAKYRALVQQLVERESWPRAEFERLCARFHLMPLGAHDAINEWADEQLGDFLLEGDDPITVHRQSLPQEVSA